MIFNIRLIANLLTALLICFAAPSYSQDDDDDSLLLMIPAIVAGSSQDGLELVKQLHGRFRFFRATDDFDFVEFYRFNQTTAAESATNPRLFTINGDSALTSSFSFEWCDGGMIGSYSTSSRLYLILCNWGFPDIDLGSVYAFDEVTNSFPFAHYFYTPSTGSLSTGIASPGTAIRLSANYKSSSSDRVTQETSEAQSLQIKTMKEKLYADYLENKQSSGKSPKIADNQLSNKVQGQLNKLLELAK